LFDLQTLLGHMRFFSFSRFQANCMVGGLILLGLLAAWHPIANTPLQTLPVHKLIGRWESLTMFVKVTSAYGVKDSSIVYQVIRDDWEKKTNSKPIELNLGADQRYSLTYRNLQSVVTRTTSGKWKITAGDTMVFMQEVPHQELIRYHVTLNNDVAVFKGKLDFDKDGKADDEYVASSRKMK
jgi:hypothetical protein